MKNVYEKRCAYCNEKISFSGSWADWGWKKFIGSKLKYFCIYSCMRAYEKASEARKKGNPNWQRSDTEHEKKV
jgi:hypothetical protein